VRNDDALPVEMFIENRHLPKLHREIRREYYSIATGFPRAF
jgi:hypothetical protein